MKKIILPILLILLVSCGQDSGKSSVNNAHKESYSDLRWSKDTNFPLIIKVPSSMYADSNFRQAIENATNTWNDTLRETIGKDVLKIESFNNTISSQLDLEKNILGNKCIFIENNGKERIVNQCQSCGEEDSCYDYCQTCYLSKNNYSNNSQWLSDQKELCKEESICNEYNRPLKISDYLEEPSQVMSIQNQWFNSSDLTIAITAYSFYTESQVITNADIIFNAEDYIFSYGDPVFANQIDLESALLHELGHFLGMSHYIYYNSSSDNQYVEKASIMYPSLSKGQIKRTLSDEDKERIQKRYK